MADSGGSDTPDASVLKSESSEDKEYIALETDEMKRLYVGGIASDSKDEDFKAFFDGVSDDGVEDYMIQRAVANVIVGDVVMIIEENVKPIHWKKGRIIEVISGRDAMIRGVKLQSTSPAGKIVKISRPLQRIIPLEIA